MSEKQELETRAERDVEQTRSGPVFTPSVDIFETEESISVLADMPGVLADDLNIDLRENVLTLIGAVKAPKAAKRKRCSVSSHPVELTIAGSLCRTPLTSPKSRRL